MAFLLQGKEIEIKSNEEFIVVVVRDNGENDKHSINIWIEKIKKYASDNSYKVIYLPFDKTDEILMRDLGLEIEYEEIYWKPKETKFIISKSKMVFSIGRFHPLIFGISSGVTTYFINCQKQDGDWRYTREGKDKSFQLLNDLNLQSHYLTNNDLNIEFEFCKEIDNVSNNIKSEMETFSQIVINQLVK